MQYHGDIWQLPLLQLSCGDICQIWMSFGGANMYFFKIENSLTEKLTNGASVTPTSGFNRCDSVSNHQSPDCLLNRLFKRRSKKTSKLRVTGLCVGNSPVAGEFPTQMTSNTKNASIWWRYHGKFTTIRLMEYWNTSISGNIEHDQEKFVLKIRGWSRE